MSVRAGSVLAVVAFFLGAIGASAADSIRIVRLSPASGSLASGSLVTVTAQYNLESAPEAKIQLTTTRVAGNPPHVGTFGPTFVSRGAGRRTATFGVSCDPRYPGPIHITRLRYSLLAQARDAAPTAVLVQHERDVDFTFACPPATAADRVKRPPHHGAPPAGADDLEIVSLTPLSGTLAPGTTVAVRYRYTLASAPNGWINTLVLDIPGNPPHTTTETPRAVRRGSANVPATLGVQCDPRYAGPIRVRTLRYTLSTGDSPSAVTTLVDKSRNVDYTFECPQPTPQLPDITSTRGITIGSVLIPWGGSGTLRGADAMASEPNGACAFNVVYDMINRGPVVTSPLFSNRLRLDGTQVAAFASSLSLDAGATRNLTHTVYLPSGTHRLTLTLDDDHSVVESDETPASNVKTITYTREGPCGGAPPQPDITSRRGITIGSVFIPWGGSGTLRGADAVAPGRDESCAFGYTYDMINRGPVATGSLFSNRLKLDGTQVAAFNSSLSLDAGAGRNITGNMYLPSGTHRLTLALDDDNSVAESDETPASNAKTVTYTREGPCEGTPPAPPAAPPTTKPTISGHSGGRGCLAAGAAFTITGRGFGSRKGKGIALGGHGIHVDLPVISWSDSAIQTRLPPDTRIRTGQSYYIGIERSDHRGWLSDLSTGITKCASPSVKQR